MAGLRRRSPAFFVVLTEVFFHRTGRYCARWLKENGEVLRTLRCPGDLAVYEPFLADLPQLMVEGIAYHRPLLEVASRLDTALALELHQQCMTSAARIVIPSAVLTLNHQSTIHFELEGRETPLDVDPLLASFANNPAQFVLSDVDAGYDLTHFVFWVTSYGQFPHFATDVCPLVVDSLARLGTTSALLGDIDLLAEACVAMVFATGGSQVVPPQWIAMVRAARETGELDYHTYLTTTWLIELVDDCAFEAHQESFSELKYELPSSYDDYLDTRDSGLIGECLYGDAFASDIERIFDWPELSGG